MREYIRSLSIGSRTISEVGAQVLESFYAELRRCRDHCDGRSTVPARHIGGHRRTQRCRRHVCNPLGDATIRKIHFLIGAAYQSAVRWEWIYTSRC